MTSHDHPAAHTDPAEEADLFLGPFEDESPAATTEWALYLGDKIVTVYDSLDEAGEAYAWYVETYGTAQLSEVLKIGQVRDADA